jgi:ABC-type transport system involved in cytochrome bd biosynthesis fused ATPase/permease subunit
MAHSNKRMPQGDEDLDAIPMKKTSSTTIFAIVGALALVGGVVVFTMRGGDGKAKAAAAAPEPAATAADTAKMTAEEYKKHLEITQKSIAGLKEQEEEAAKKKAAEEEAKAKEASAAGVVRAPGAAAPAGEEGAAPAPKKPSKKQMDDLQGLGDIASQLGK